MSVSLRTWHPGHDPNAGSRSGRRGLPWAIVFAAVVCLPGLGRAVPTEPDDDHHDVAHVTSLSAVMIAARPTVTIRGQLIAIDDSGAEAILEDATAGVRILGVTAAERADGAGDLAVGDVVEVQGGVETSRCHPAVRAARIERLGALPLPDPRDCDVAAFFEGVEACRLVAVTGIVERAWRADDRLMLELQAAGRLFTATLPAAAAAQVDGIGADPRGLVDAFVRVAGPAENLCTTREVILRPHVRVDRPEWLTILEPAMQHSFHDVAIPIHAIGGYRPARRPGHLIGTFGQVIHAVPGVSLRLQNGPHGIEVRFAADAEGSATSFSPGDRVEVTGFLDRMGTVDRVRNASARRISDGVPPPPIVVTPAAILAANGAPTAPTMIPAPGDYQGCLVRCSGLVIQSQPITGGGEVLIDSDGVIVPVVADTATFATVAETLPGSRVTVTAVALIDPHPSVREGTLADPPCGLRLLLRGADDFRTLSSPPWWNGTRLLMGLAVAGCVLAAAVAWAVVLRRQLLVQKQLLAAEMRSRRDAAVEFDATLRERNRLAANLHDTLQQTIAGIGFQLDACATSDDAPAESRSRHLAVARRMVHHASKELQGSVWTMRSLPLDGTPFEEALATLVTRVTEGYDVQLTVHAGGGLEELPEFVAGSVLLIVQEAVHNAVKHGRPSRIDIRVDDDPATDHVVVRVADDGSGFGPATAAGPRDGHFGIQGMRERAERLGGRLEITSRPGAGVVVTATVQRRDYDTDIDTRPALSPPRETRPGVSGGSGRA